MCDDIILFIARHHQHPHNQPAEKKGEKKFYVFRSDAYVQKEAETLIYMVHRGSKRSNKRRLLLDEKTLIKNIFFPFFSYISFSFSFSSSSSDDDDGLRRKTLRACITLKEIKKGDAGLRYKITQVNNAGNSHIHTHKPREIGKEKKELWVKRRKKKTVDVFDARLLGNDNGLNTLLNIAKRLRHFPWTFTEKNSRFSLQLQKSSNYRWCWNHLSCLALSFAQRNMRQKWIID